MRHVGLIALVSLASISLTLSGCDRGSAQAAMTTQPVPVPATTSPDLSIRGFAHQVAERGIELIDLTGSGTSDAEIDRIGEFRDCARAKRFLVGDTHTTVVVFELRRRSDSEYFADFLPAGTRYAMVGNIAVLDDETTADSGLDHLIPVLDAMNGSVFIAQTDGSLADDEFAMLASHDAIHAATAAQIAIDIYHDQEGSLPWPGKQITAQWQPLIGDYLTHAPRNPLSPKNVASRIVTSGDPQATGVVVDPANAGWLWNSATGKLYPAGIAAVE